MRKDDVRVEIHYFIVTNELFFELSQMEKDAIDLKESTKAYRNFLESKIKENFPGALVTTYLVKLENDIPKEHIPSKTFVRAETWKLSQLIQNEVDNLADNIFESYEYWLVPRDN